MVLGKEFSTVLTLIPCLATNPGISYTTNHRDDISYPRIKFVNKQLLHRNYAMHVIIHQIKQSITNLNLTNLSITNPM